MSKVVRTNKETQNDNEISLLNLEEGNEKVMADEVEIKKNKRSAYATFLNTGTKVTPTWQRMGKGISEMEQAYNAEEESEKYIDEDSATNSVTSYAPAFEVEQKCYAGEKIFEYIDKKRRDRAIESDAETQTLDVFMYDKKAEGVYGAELSDAIVVISKFSGDVIGYSVKKNGDPVQGYVTIQDKTVTFKEGEYSAS